MRISLRAVAALATTIVAAASSTGHAQTPAEFFKRAGLTMYVGSGPSGGFDSYARIFAPHFTRHVPGNPPIVVKNMPGANGLVAMNYLANSAPRDGSALLASFNTVILNHLYGDANSKFDPRQLSWLGSLGRATATCVTWNTSATKTIADAQVRETLVGATGASSTPVMYPKLLNAMLATKFKVISGYTTPGVRLAVEAGELEGICGHTWETHMAAVPHWIIDKRVNFILQLGLKENPNLKGVPLALDYIKDPANRQVFALIGTPLEFSRPIVGPPGVPADRLQALQKAFQDTVRDPAYLADAERAKTYVDVMTAQESLALLAQAYAAPKDIISRAAVYAVTEN